MSAPTTSHGQRGISWCMILSWGCVCWNWRHVGHCLIYLSIPAFILGQYTHSWASSFVFSMPMWFVYNWLSTCSFKLLVIMMHLPLSITPFITASSSLYDQYGCKSAYSSSLLSGQPEIIIPFSCCRWLSSDDACCISAIHTHSGISVTVCIASTFISMPLIGLSFPSVWLCLNSQSAMKISGPGLYMIWTLYWCIFNGMCCMCCDNVATSFFKHIY